MLIVLRLSVLLIRRSAAAAGSASSAGIASARSLRVLAPERLVDVDEHLLLPLTETLVGEDRGDQFRVAFPEFEDPGPDVELLGGDPQPLGDLLQDLRAGLAQSALDLRRYGLETPASRAS